MKNPLGHFTIAAPANLLRTIFAHLHPRIRRESVSRSYFGFATYLEWRTTLAIPTGAQIVFRNDGFLIVGTERSSFRGWAGRNAIFMEKNSSFEVCGFNQLGRGSLLWVLNGGIVRMKGCSTTGNNMIISKELVEIGEGTQIAWGVTISDHDFHKTYTKGEQNVETAPVRIGRNCWIGADAKILKGVEIGDNAIVAAGAIVTRSVPAAALVAGVPAKVIKRDVEFYG